MKYLISYKRHDGAIDFTGNDVDIYYLFFVVHELGRCLYKMEYDKTFNSSELITLIIISVDFLTVGKNLDLTKHSAEREV